MPAEAPIHPDSRRDAFAATADACTHCGQPVPAGLRKAGAAHQFCCHGCEMAYQVIHACGLDRYYKLREEAGAVAAARTTGRAYTEFDDSVFQALYVQRTPPTALGGASPASACSVDLFLEGVHCSACVWLVEKLPRLVPGVVAARLDLRRAIVRVTWDPAVLPLSRIAKALDSIGYPPHPARDARSRAIRAGEDRRQLIRIAVAGACAGNVMLFALALYAGVFDVMEPAYAQFFRWGSMGITLVALLWPGQVFFRSAWAAIRTRTAHLDVPIALALAAGGVWSVISTLRGSGEVYFDTLSVLVFVLLVGRFIQHRQQRWSADAVELLFSLTPTAARLVDGEAVRDIPIEALKPDDIVEVRAGESLPADGVILSASGPAGARSSVDQSLLTGESRPVTVSAGDRVCAGSVNLSASLLVRVEAAGEGTRVGKLMRMVEDCARRRAPIVRLADRASNWFIVGMLGLSVLTFGLWFGSSPRLALEHAVALLVVTCPCALGLATPLALTVALGRAARAGVLVKGGDAVQRLATPGRIFLDKTGTLTFGRLSLARWIGDTTVRPAVAALEAHSSHPIALALTRDLAPFATTSIAVAGVSQTTGGGISGVIDRRRLLVGSPAFLRHEGVSDPSSLWSHEAALSADGFTPIGIALDGQLAAIAGLGDQIRPDAAEAIARLRALGWAPMILSGDHPQVVAAVAAKVGIAPSEARGGLSPEDKLAIVQQAAAAGVAVMVGDGVNDSAALAAASVGIAVHGGAEASLAAADAYINRPGLLRVVELVEGCRRTMGVVKRNLAASTLYNLVAAVAAVAGLVSPIGAAVLMPISSLTVLTLSFRARTFGGRP